MKVATKINSILSIMKKKKKKKVTNHISKLYSIFNYPEYRNCYKSIN